jgi:DNA repair protein RecN (Recombination protein N)
VLVLWIPVSTGKIIQLSRTGVPACLFFHLGLTNFFLPLCRNATPNFTVEHDKIPFSEGFYVFQLGNRHLLYELRVRNLGIIEDITWRLSDGLNVITGETGAGKSLLIDALELLLSGKTDEDAVRHGANEALIEGVFKLGQNENFRQLKELLAQKGLAEDDDTLVISCQLRRKGSGVIRLNGNVITKSLLRQIRRLLVDVNGQNEHFSLLDNKSHIDILDAYAHTLGLRGEFAAKAGALHQNKLELQRLLKNEQDRAKHEEFLRFQVNEINQAKLQDGEEEELEQKQKILASVETLKSYSWEVYQTLQSDDSGLNSTPAIDKLSAACRTMRKLVELDPALKEQLKIIEDAVSALTEAARDIQIYNDGLNFDPESLAEAETRLELIRHLKRKYGQTISEILAYGENTAVELKNLEHNTERIAQLEEETGVLRYEAGRFADRLSKERNKAVQKLAFDVKKELNDLNMAQVEFGVTLNLNQDKNGIPLPDGNFYSFSENGVDTVEFMAATNTGEPMKPLIKIASTGELSRFTLALKSALSEADNIPVLIFDEIDIGVGGRSGEILGKKLWSLGQNHQVICITHLPQIAAFADAHFGVHKETSAERTLSVLQNLDGDVRVKELTVMLSGPDISKVSLSNAKELLHKAEAWKKDHKK